MADPILPTACDFHGKCRDLLHAVKLRHGTDGFTSPPKEGMLRIFRPKNPTASAGFEPANSGTSMLTTRPLKPLGAQQHSITEKAIFFTRSQNCEKRLFASSCLSVCLSLRLQGTTLLSLNGFS